MLKRDAASHTPQSTRPIDGQSSGRKTMFEVTRDTGLTARAVRHYEAEGLISLLRDMSGRRTLTPDDCARLQAIATLRMAGVSLADIGIALEARDRFRPRAAALVACRIAGIRDELSGALDAAARIDAWTW